MTLGPEKSASPAAANEGLHELLVLPALGQLQEGRQRRQAGPPPLTAPAQEQEEQ